jgi:hypothetical protein
MTPRQFNRLIHQKAKFGGGVLLSDGRWQRFRLGEYGGFYCFGVAHRGHAHLEFDDGRRLSYGWDGSSFWWVEYHKELVTKLLLYL